MLYVHSLGRAARYYPKRTGLCVRGKHLSFSELDVRVGQVAASLVGHGFRQGDRLAVLLPNESEYIELVYACARLGLIVVPINVRYSALEIDRVIQDAAPRGLVRQQHQLSEWRRRMREQ